jgi:hypothetical protein
MSTRNVVQRRGGRQGRSQLQEALAAVGFDVNVNWRQGGRQAGQRQRRSHEVVATGVFNVNINIEWQRGQQQQ